MEMPKDAYDSGDVGHVEAVAVDEARAVAGDLGLHELVSPVEGVLLASAEGGRLHVALVSFDTRSPLVDEVHEEDEFALRNGKVARFQVGKHLVLVLGNVQVKGDVPSNVVVVD